MYMKTLISVLLMCLVCTPAFAGRDDLIIYHSGDGTYVRTEIIDHCVDNGYIRPAKAKVALRFYCDDWDQKGRVSVKDCEKEKVVREVLKRHMFLKESIDLGAKRIFTRYYRDVYVSKRSFPTCKDSIVEKAHEVFQSREATLQERLFYGALFQNGVETIINETISPKQASEGRWGGEDDNQRSIMIHYDTPNCRSGGIDQSTNEFSENDFFQMGGEGSGSGRLGGEGSGSGRLGGEGSGTGKVITRVNITPQRINTLRITPNFLERRLGLKPAFATYLTGEEEIPRSVLGVKCQK